MTKRELAVRISAETGWAQEDVLALVQKTLDRIVEALAKGRRVEFRDFGVFEVCRRKARTGRNPKRPNVAVRIPERRVVKFKPGKTMRERVAKA
jgi:integration host factor subunit beta